MGAVPITSRHGGSVVRELTALFDLGPPAREGLIKNDPGWLQEWVAAVIDATSMDLTTHRCVRVLFACGRPSIS